MTYLIKDLPAETKPREKFLELGLDKLNDEELLAIILRTGTPSKSVLDVSRDILISVGGITKLKDNGVNNLIKIKGIGITKAITIISAIELGKRAYNVKSKYKSILRNSNDVYELLKGDLKYELQEKMIALYLDNKKKLISAKTVFIGTINSSVVHPREIFREAIKESSSSIILVHNHPSGDTKPSINDDMFTYQMKDASNLLDIPLLDHVIIGDNKYYSYADVNWDEEA